ncbi:precorrin-8X methylmutase [Candidatus Contubernalis alkaliaceticus]|uniref:precorrin-8X methylmutase n=1 Tax=Candidatus Contubernalis alkaliaceticus TaxID=338645 RepID=UPI001F4BE6D0|nr:precorrin-8X methylmutase [Candidatus Contubernalis alkalaceticus]UNC92493.1 precorrin-8X methylmutase [Candidatus Contubernalis alkalaceticus]
MDIINEPLKIEEKSMAIIEEHLQGMNIPFGEKQVTKRVIHATGDPTYAGIMAFSPQAVKTAVNILKEGKNIITDVEMVRVGINKKITGRLGGLVECFMHHPEVIKGAEEEKITRASFSMHWAKEKINGNIVVIGNAPTALFTLLDIIEKKEVKPAFIIGVPVGFVGSAEAKEALEMQQEIPYITLKGVKGGSPVAVSITNALLKLADG